MASHPAISQHEPSFDGALYRSGLGQLRRAAIQTLQLNVGKVCNQACRHCHVEAGPLRTESMSQETAERAVELLRACPSVDLVDITGGAPELNPIFRWLVTEVNDAGRRVMDRCNLTILLEPGHEDLAGFLASRHVEVTASMPCYEAANVDRQRGRGVFDKSIAALKMLNALGYGQPGSGLQLNLVYNPGGPFLPPCQDELKADYERELLGGYGVVFNELFTITNMPIKRFLDALIHDGEYDRYMNLLVNSFNPETVPGLMCKTMISVGWDGQLYDCDFNQMLDLRAGDDGASERKAGAKIATVSGRAVTRSSRPLRSTLWEIESYTELNDQRIATGSHCFGCTAGAGSSCGGALE